MWVTMTKTCRQRIFGAGGARGKEIVWDVITIFRTIGKYKSQENLFFISHIIESY